MNRLTLLLLVASPLSARADATAGPGPCVSVTSGCSCDSREDCKPAFDLSAPRPDLAPPHDLRSPADARRERSRAGGRGLILLSGAGLLAVAALRRRYKTSRPTPAESALAASDTSRHS